MSSSSSVFLDIARWVFSLDACLAKLPPCEATFTQHVLRSSLQISIWMTYHVAKQPMKSAVVFGWEDRNGSAGKMLHKTGLRMLQIECTRMHENAHPWSL
jgi:hypothetical protein